MQNLKALTFKQLRALTAVAEHGTIAAAADTLSLSSPAVHSQLKLLEENVGVPLIDRDVSGQFHATQEGQILIDAFEKAWGALSRAAEDIDAVRRGAAGRVMLGVVSTGKYFAPGIVARLKDLHPEIEIRLIVGNRNEIIEGLEAEKIDIAVMGRPPRQPDVTAQSLGPHPHVLIAKPDHPLVGAGKVRKADILAQHFLMREEGSGTRILTMRYLDRLGQGKVYDFTEMGSNETIKQSVIAGLGVALLSAHTVIDELRSGRLAIIQAEGLPIMRYWFVLHRSQQRLTGAMQVVWDEIRTHATEMIRSEEVAAAISD
ncbi:LysR substrate-binding domain-containing protein [Thalassovita mangrovi]|uniref:HTH-type transcriptional regulator CbbR n=1 Tax=Thalassovita mangrovi TaxID=2692236 RepID=A0A6L8LM51_9RHOB|nr:LysR substrate-binding domain-containing protein [Thalassovita mangrovi]MYM57084.1 LysR family transcriptional regulator [Thalassovita mangrovi]